VSERRIELAARPAGGSPKVFNGLRFRTIPAFLRGPALTSQSGKAASLNAVYHFTFPSREEKQATGTADSETWLGFLAQERSLLWALWRRRARIRGPPRLLIALGKCFPSAWRARA
jgi:hypothetical protein